VQASIAIIIVFGMTASVVVLLCMPGGFLSWWQVRDYAN
jgi:hypothetical protein